MKLHLRIPTKSINKSFQKNKVNRNDFENFKTQLKIIIEKIDKNESEEHLKNLLIQFLKNTFYQNHEVNTKGRTDLAIYNGNTNEASVSVLFETKKPDNKADMLTKTDINKKALHEIILYYLQERIAFKNNDIKNIIITNLNEWFIFDAIDFERVFFTTELIKEYQKWKTGQKTSTNTDLFYNEIAKKYIKQNNVEIECTYVDFQTFKNIDKIPENKLINLYKLFSPTHLLKLAQTNDSNSLDTGFYNELLHVLGLEEKQINAKKIIQRKEKAKRNPASLLENTITILATEDRLKHIHDIENRYGLKPSEQIINVAMELNIMWINRILFLKLLEAQLIQYHTNNSDYSFLNSKNIVDFDELNELFFEVLAKQPHKRNSEIKEKFKNIPYLNSSLFEISQLEDETIRINSLKSRLKLPKSIKSVLSTKSELTILEYILNFLDAYDFTSEGSGKVQEENKNLINASVLGLIFEKINGYKDGSYFTPGYVTMYMSRENIRRAVVQKFKESNFPNLANFEELKDKIEDRKEANKIINSLKICDPAVGSGHFLVSALNEIIAIKSELGILTYRNGNRIKDYKIEIVNDELIISDKETEDLFEYSLNKKDNPIDYKQDLQEALFHEKQTIIENCLFGVDINPNSVNICRLRLWIELLKNSFYTKESKYSELETLPNIDINIKQGNSLVGRFALNGNGITKGQAQKMKLATQKYKTQVILYKSTNNKIVKQKAENEISRIKQDFAQNVNPTDKDYILLQQKKAKLAEMPMFFSEIDKEEWKKEAKKITNEVIELEKKYEKKLQTLYGNAFEWRFEFPEVLDENGNFVGFDIVIGNPPYITLLLGKNQKNQNQNVIQFYKNYYELFEYKGNTFTLFTELGERISSKSGILSFIVPNTLLLGNTYSKTRKFLLANNLQEIMNITEEIFEHASIGGVTIFRIEKSNFDSNYSYSQIDDITKLNKNSFQTNKINKEFALTSHLNKFYATPETFTLLNKISGNNSIKLADIVKSYQGIITGNNKKFIASKKINSTYKKILKGKDINRYKYNFSDNYVLFEPKKLWSNTNTTYFYKDEKIISRQTSDKLIAAYDDNKMLCLDSTHIHFLINNEFYLKYVLALFNSKLLNFYYQILVNEGNRVFAQVKIVILKSLPIKKIPKLEQKLFVKKIDEILKLKQENPKTNTTKLEAEIDQMVYKIYQLSKEEIKIIENNYKIKS